MKLALLLAAILILATCGTLNPSPTEEGHIEIVNPSTWEEVQAQYIVLD